MQLWKVSKGRALYFPSESIRSRVLSITVMSNSSSPGQSRIDLFCAHLYRAHLNNWPDDIPTQAQGTDIKRASPQIPPVIQNL